MASYLCFQECSVNDSATMKKKDTHTLFTNYPQVFHNRCHQCFTSLIPS